MCAYRRVTEEAFGQEVTFYELAGSDWKRSDARDVTAWFDADNMSQSPDETNGRQLRRICRLIKKFSKSRKSWTIQILGGFGITKLVTERYAKNADREDVALYDTMKAIRDRLAISLVVTHPVTPNETITNGFDDSKAKFLKDRLSDAIEWLKPLFEPECTRNRALKCWDDVFNTDFFSKRGADETPKSASASLDASSFLTSGLLKSAAAAATPSISKDGGGRYA